MIEQQDDLETRAVLLTAARELIADEPDFQIKTLLTRTGVSRAAFRRCFADKTELVAGLAGEDIKGLDDILNMAQPVRLAVGSDITGGVTPAPALTDAWLERRLRVFERALGMLEKRQERSERTVAQQLALINETLATLLQARPHPAMFETAPEPRSNACQAPESEAASEPVSEPGLFEFATALSEGVTQSEAEPEAEVEPEAVLEPEAENVSPDGVLAELESFTPKISEEMPADSVFAPVLEEAAPEQTTEDTSHETAEEIPETEFAAEIAAVEQSAEELTAEAEQPAEEQPMTTSMTDTADRTEHKEKKGEDIVDFIAHARRAAQNAHMAQSKKPERAWDMRVVALGGAAAAVLLLCGGVLLSSLGGDARAVASAPTAQRTNMVMTNAGANAGGNAGISHRQAASPGLAHLIALADSGNAAAQTALALAYLKGQGVAADDSAARRWSLAAATQGQPVAEYVLGTLYLEGARNEGEAARWFLAAAGQGNVKAMHNLAIAYAEGQGVQKDPSEAVKWFVRAAEQGYRDSQFDLGVVYERGLGVPQSARAALKWYLIAAAHGDVPSAARAQVLKDQMDASEAKLAAQDAASFVPQSAAGSANQAPVI